MNTCQIINEIEKKHMVEKRPNFKVGDTIRVHTKIVEGEKERMQIFTGIVIARKSNGLSETFSVYRNAYNCSMERVFLLHSPRIVKIEVVRQGKVRRAKLFYLRGKSGKASKVKERLMTKEDKKKKPTEAPIMEEKVVEEIKKETTEENPES